MWLAASSGTSHRQRREPGSLLTTNFSRVFAGVTGNAGRRSAEKGRQSKEDGGELELLSEA